MPHVSEKNILLHVIDWLELKVAEQRLRNLQEQDEEDEPNSDDSLLSQEYLIITLPSPFLNIGSDVESTNLDDSTEGRMVQYHCLLGAIWAFQDEVAMVCILNHVAELPLCASQLHLLNHFSDFRPHLFHKKVHVDREVFDCILDQISSNLIFDSGSNNLQLPVAIQLTSS